MTLPDMTEELWDAMTERERRAFRVVEARGRTDEQLERDLLMCEGMPAITAPIKAELRRRRRKKPPSADVPKPQNDERPAVTSCEAPETETETETKDETNMNSVAPEPNEATDTATETMLEAALELARAGFAVFPIWPVNSKHKKGTGKHPRCWHGHNDATTDEAQIERWWSEPESGAADAWQCSPDNNIGIAVPEGLVIVDVDPRNGGDETFGKMCDENNWDLVCTLTVNTGGGGKQYYLSCEPGRKFPANLNEHFGTGIDLKQFGGYVVAPPSKHKSGGVYTWDQTIADIEPAPAWLTLLSKVKSAEERAPAPDVPDGAELDDDLRAKLDQAIELIEPFYTNGSKHWIALAIGGYFRNASLPAIAAKYVVSQLPCSDPSARVNDALWAYLPTTNNPSGAQAFRDLSLGDLLQALDTLGLDLRSRMRDKQKANREKASAQPAADTAEPAYYILQSSKHAETILFWRGADRGHQPVAIGSLRLLIKEAGLTEKLPLAFDVEGSGGKVKQVKFPAPTIVERNGKTFDHTIYDFSLRVSEYEPQHSRVIVGYPDASPSGVFDSDVDAWLRALGGADYERLAVWIASCAQRHATRLSAALMLIGPSDSGKSLFSCAAAGLWGAAKPPAAALLVERFNGGLTACPVVCDEEAKLFGGGKFSTKQFRDVTQHTERPIELKGQETFALRGALRIIVPCNQVSDLRFTDLGGPDIVKAVSDRILLIDCKPRESDCKAALAKLRLPGAYECDRDRVIGHMAWLSETVPLPAERFLGAGGAGASSVLAGHVEANAALWETFREWLECDGNSPGWIWIAHAEKLYVDPAELAKSLEQTGRGWDLAMVRAALAPLKLHDGGQPRIGADQPRRRLWEIDHVNAAGALRLDRAESAALDLRLAKSKKKPPLRNVGGRWSK